ncbi:retinitis pigmentosa 9 protein isoform X1 [Elephas maximus indicus]|uniref:retinitis pigmentosa 9 protein isoform X1 n=1 Tax=Elephas maximus indicus TaxID=99487 RepID=UPI0021163F88|nr:retinitis pigmentosa 9 protein isoform X1 [Elephas maximus indicus]
MSSRPGRDDAAAGGARRPREPPEQELQRRREQKRRRHDAQQLQQLKHLESFYEKPPPGLIKEDETKPEDCIPDVPGNEHAREFLAHAPTKGLWMPLGKEVKVMQCWRCKRYGHRTGDKECPFFIKGNQKLEQFRVAHEDPMYDIIRENKRHEKDVRSQCGTPTDNQVGYLSPLVAYFLETYEKLSLTPACPCYVSSGAFHKWFHSLPAPSPCIPEGCSHMHQASTSAYFWWARG